MDFYSTTLKYYSHWLGIDIAYVKDNEIATTYSEERNKIQPGYTRQYDLLLWYQDTKIIISYGKNANDHIKELARTLKFGLDIDNIKDSLFTSFGKKPNHNIKYVFSNLPVIQNSAKVLTLNDYQAYLAFFKTNNPNCKDLSWLHDYFARMTESGTCCGVFIDNILVSCTDSPGMPYMQDKVQEIGINTLPEFRGKGYASLASIKSASQIINDGKCPQWSTSTNNFPSQKLAYRVGFNKLAETLAITL